MLLPTDEVGPPSTPNPSPGLLHLPLATRLPRLQQCFCLAPTERHVAIPRGADHGQHAAQRRKTRQIVAQQQHGEQNHQHLER